METLRILVTDDEMGMRLAVIRALTDFTIQVPDGGNDVGFAVEEVENGEQAMEIIEHKPPDILLLDHKMPGMSGLDVLEQVAVMNLDMLTIMITAYASIETAVTATKQGAYDFLAKPFTPQELKTTIRKAATRIILGRQAQRLAEEKRQVRFQFIRVLGHELKAPLGAVEGYLDMMAGRSLGPALNDYSEPIGRCQVRIEGMKKLIADLLDMTHIESGQRTRQLASVDLREAAKAALETLRPNAKAHKVSMQIEEGESVVITADRSEIDMIFNNLVSNAIKYNRPGGHVAVSMKKSNDLASISVTDTGIGIEPGEISRLFEEFVRIKTPETADVLGSGLGLSIVKKLADLYAGEVSVTSQPGQGSTFTVTLTDSDNSPPMGTSVDATSANHDS